MKLQPTPTNSLPRLLAFLLVLTFDSAALKCLFKKRDERKWFLFFFEFNLTNQFYEFYGSWVSNSCALFMNLKIWISWISFISLSSCASFHRPSIHMRNSWISAHDPHLIGPSPWVSIDDSQWWISLMGLSSWASGS